MAGHAVEHDYHLIPPSPWPFLSGCACLVWGLGMVVFFAGLVDRTGESPMMEWFFGNGLDTLKSTMVGDGSVSGGWIILLIGCLFASYVMYGWWKDVAAESEAGDHTPVVDIGKKPCSLLVGFGCSLNSVFSKRREQSGILIFWKMLPNMRIQWRLA